MRKVIFFIKISVPSISYIGNLTTNHCLIFLIIITISFIKNGSKEFRLKDFCIFKIHYKYIVLH